MQRLSPVAIHPIVTVANDLPKDIIVIAKEKPLSCHVPARTCRDVVLSFSTVVNVRALLRVRRAAHAPICCATSSVQHRLPSSCRVDALIERDGAGTLGV